MKRKINFSWEAKAVFAELEAMFKALPPWAFETAADRERQRFQRRVRGNPDMARVEREAAAMVKSYAKPGAARVVSIEVNDHSAEAAEVVAKSFDALMHRGDLSPAARGEIMLGLSALADKVFRKAEPHPMAEKVARIRAMLDKVHRNGQAKRAEPIIREALEHIDRGVIDQGDYHRLCVLLQGVASQLKAGDTDV